jgi:hypothetical protein
VISLKHHAVSIAAIFLALAVGIVLGSQSIASGVLSGLRDDKSDLQHQLDAAQDRNTVLVARGQAADGFDAALAPRILRDVLAHRSVVVVTTPSADAGDIEAVGRDLVAAGATVTGTVGLTAALLDPANGDRLRTLVTNMIPAGVALHTGTVDQGSLVGDFLGTVLQLNAKTQRPQSTPAELTLALDTLRDGGFLSYGGGTVRPAQTMVVITGGGESNDNAGAVLARFAGGLRGRGQGTVLAGRAASADGNGAIAMTRSDSALASEVSTVDDVDGAAGRITVALALAEQLAGGAGRYGVGPKAAAVTVGAVGSDAAK